MSSESVNLGHFIDGQLVNDQLRTAPVTNPALGKVIGQVALASDKTVDQAVQAAERAFRQWREIPPIRKAAYMFRFKQLLQTHASKVVAAITREHGKALADAKGEFERGLEVVDFACGMPQLLKGEYLRNAGPQIDSWSDYEPLGVVAGITPFNFPAMVPMWMFPIAIASGNTFVLKPSEKDPSASLMLADLMYQAGFPNGVFNVVNGDRQAVDALIRHPCVRALSFVGSTPIAEYIYTEGTKVGKRVQALGGAKNHAVVMPDADIENTANALLGAAYGSCGERCMAISVAVCVGEAVSKAVVNTLKPKLAELRIGCGTQKGTEMGPLVTQDHLKKVLRYIDIGVDEGARLAVDGRGLTVKGNEHGYFLGPCLFDNVQPDMTIYREEIFGPVLCVVTVDSQEQAMQLINQHEYGNGTCIFTRDGESARYFANHIEVGMVGINVPLPVPIAFHSFGGWKRSLFGDLHMYGSDGVRFYTRRKTITQRWPSSGMREKIKYDFPSS